MITVNDVLPGNESEDLLQQLITNIYIFELTDQKRIVNIKSRW